MDEDGFRLRVSVGLPGQHGKLIVGESEVVKALAGEVVVYLSIPIEELERLAETAGWELVTYQPSSRPYLAILRHRDDAATH